MKRFHQAAVCVAVTLILAPGPLWAADCPADLSSLAPKIHTANFAAKLGTAISKIVSDAGGLDPAIAQAKAKLSDIQSRRAQLPAGEASPVATAMDDAILILSVEIDALQCLQRN